MATVEAKPPRPCTRPTRPVKPSAAVAPTAPADATKTVPLDDAALKAAREKLLEDATKAADASKKDKPKEKASPWGFFRSRNNDG
jgi:hypothetical protein